ncbi:MAG: translation initiation factor IF-2 [Alphaproteobacteria bacterium]|jgi:translation initiation factor IF-2|nr:translation initiation factor IF-2 [Alphaproteobacteria bacterium]
MSDEGNIESGREKKPLSLKRQGRPDASQSSDGGQVRQSFSHGRSRSVAVEVRKKRSIKQVGGAAAAPVKARAVGTLKAREPDAGEPAAVPAKTEEAEQDAPKSRVVLRTLTQEEKATRARAVEDAVKEEGRKRLVAEHEAALRAEEDKTRAAEREEAERRAAEEEARRKEEEEKRRQAEEAAARRLAAPEEEAAESASDSGTERASAKREATAEEEEAPRRGRRRAEIRRAPSTGKRDRDSNRRRGGKLTVSRALETGGEDVRSRSMASLKRQRERERRMAAEAGGGEDAGPVVREVVVPETITVQELANRMAVRGIEVVKKLMQLGIAASMAQSIEGDTAELVVHEFGHKVKRVSASDVEIGLEGETDDAGSLVSRPPVVTVMGHVDHGKTSLLDAMRATDIASGEAGGITQHIGAYQVEMANGARITFIDTPGHAAFTQMRSRGAKITDIVILVVAADDGVMPQTVEAINHARAAKVPLIIAINKIDRPDANPNRVRQELLQHEIVTEEMGGDVLSVEVSAMQKTNLDKLEEAIILQSEILELAANPERDADGVVIESRVDRGRGVVCTFLVQRGSLHVGDIVVAGAEWGRVRAMMDDRGQNRKEALPASPVEVLGFNGPPNAGDEFVVVENERRAREISEFRGKRLREVASARGASQVSVEQMFSQADGDGLQRLPLVIKGDVHGSVEAVNSALENLSTEEVAVQVLHAGVGGITESDVILAAASNASIIGFNVRANPQARVLAQRDGIDIRYYAIIYNIVDDTKAMLEGMLKPALRERKLGNAAILQIFDVGKVGKVAGCRVTDGVVRRNAKVRLLRDDIVIHDGTLKTLRSFKDDVREVKEGYDCGMAFENYSDIREGDIAEFYEIEEVARVLES